MKFPMSPLSLFAVVVRQRQLILQMTRREITMRYQGSVLGLVWSFFIPVLMLAVYTFVFSEIFKARWGEGGDSKTQFALILFSGLLLFNFFAECINRAPSLILGNANFVKKVIFPLEILPMVAVGAGLFNLLVSFIVWLLFYFIFFGLPPVTILLFPVVALPLVLLTLGLSWFLAALGVFLRDVAQITTVITTTLMFLTPIFYPATAIPERYRFLLHLNPLAVVVEQARGATIFGVGPDALLLGASYLGSIVVFWLGLAFFQRTRGAFADVM
ncbi:ABC transporter permease [Achromobacter sp. KS-M25]|nr:ABC transporter permease [Achromobacter aestuarii]